jgi:MFS family permease
MLWMMVIVRIAMGFQFQSAAGTSTYLVERFGVDYATIGALVGFYLLPGIVLVLPSGFIARRLGEKRLLLIGLALMTAGGAVTGLAATYDQVAVGRLVAGSGVVLLFVVMTKAVGDWFQGRARFVAMALFLNGWPLGMGAAILAAPVIAETWNWTLVFLVSAALTALGFLAMLVYFRSAPGTAEAAARREAIPARAMALVVLAGAAWGVVNAGHIVFVSFAPAYLVSKGLSTIEAGALVSLNLWVAIAGVQAGGSAIARWGRPVFWTCATTLVSATAAFLFVATGWHLPFLLLMGAVAFFGAGVQASLPMEPLSLGQRGAGLSVFYMLWYAAFGGLPPVAGWLRDLTGDPAAPLLFGAALVALNAPLLVAFRIFQARWRLAPAAAN